MISIDDKQNNKILLLGVGNILLGDEGVGVHTVTRLREEGLPGNVEAVDGGTGGPELAYLLEDVAKLIIVDCLDTGAEPGSILRFCPEDILDREKAKISCHDMDLMNLVKKELSDPESWKNDITS